MVNRYEGRCQSKSDQKGPHERYKKRKSMHCLLDGWSQVQDYLMTGPPMQPGLAQSGVGVVSSCGLTT